ncbi:peroxisomal acyl-coenzyme A oxidase 2 [Prionailurus iriomotensis]
MEPAPDPGLGDSSLHRYLDGEFWSLKNEPRRLLGGSPLFRHRYDLSLDETGALTFQRVQFVMGLPLLKRAIQEQAENTKNCVSRSLAIGEVLSMADMATGVKISEKGEEGASPDNTRRGIIYWLFGGAVRNLGSPGHVTKWLQPLQGQKYTGMFAVTERGHGSVVRGIQTQATFDLSAQEFVIDTPCENAEKMFVGNAMHGNYAAVFAQLIINGRSQGPHCCIVPVRDENGSLYPGVTAVDMMYKEGLRGVDNGILIFHEVRIPRENLLDKLGLTIAIRCSHSRRQFGPKAKKEVKIIEHQTQTLRLMPHLATALALTFASRSAGGLLDKDVFRGKELVDSRPLQALGYMMENRISGLKCDTDVFVTFEGDNVVMLQVVVRELLARYTKQHQEKPLSPVFRDWAESGSDKLRTSFLAFDVDTVGNLAFPLKAVNFRERALRRSLVARIHYKLLDLCDSVKDDALRVISAFNIPHTSLHAPIAGITNAQAAWAFYPAPPQPQAREGARSRRPKLGAKL